MNTRAQIVATIGPASESPEILRTMLTHGLDVVRLNFSWGEAESRIRQINLVRKLGAELNRHIPIIIDLPGPRVQEGSTHSFDSEASSSLTDHDEKCIQFGVAQGVEYFAFSFVGSAKDVEHGRDLIQKYAGNQKIIAKIERAVALAALDEIISASDAIMIARGDLGSEVPLEQIPFVQEKIIAAAKAARKPVITATQMLLSMVESPTPTRAEVTDVTNAILEGADAVMLSEESAIGKHPIEAVTMMDKIRIEAQAHMAEKPLYNQL